MKYIGNGEGHTLLILTDAESRLLRAVLETLDASFAQQPKCAEALAAFNAGIARGTAKIQEEFDQLQRDKKAKKKAPK